MTTNNEAFKEYLNKFKHITGGLRVYSELNEHEKYIAKDAWQAATTEANKRIAELESEVAQLNRVINVHADLRDRYRRMIAELQANNNQLREALKRALEDLVPHHTKASTYKVVNEALSATPAESLQEHDNEVIEKCAVRGRLAQLESRVVDIEIRALKGN